MMTTFDDNDADRTNMCLWWRSTSPPSFTLSRLSPGFCHHHHHVDDNHSGNGDHHPHHPMLSSIFSLKSCFSFLANSPLVTREHLTSLRWLLHLSVVHTLQRTVAQLIRICGTHNLDCFFIVDILCSLGIFATFISKDYAEKNVWFRQVNVGAAPSGPQLIEQFYKKVGKEKHLHQVHKFSTYTNIID